MQFMLDDMIDVNKLLFLGRYINDYQGLPSIAIRTSNFKKISNEINNFLLPLKML